jgi:hypothetical protein
MKDKIISIHFLFGILLVILAALWAWSVFELRQKNAANQAYVRKQILQAEAAVKVWEDQKKENPVSAPAVPANMPIIPQELVNRSYHQGLVYGMLRLYTMLAFQIVLIGWITIAHLRRAWMLKTCAAALNREAPQSYQNVEAWDNYRSLLAQKPVVLVPWYGWLTIVYVVAATIWAFYHAIG